MIASTSTGGVGESREQDRRHVGPAHPDLLEEFDAGHPGHALVGDHHIDRRPGENLERLRPRLGLVDLVVGLEKSLKYREVAPVVVDDEDGSMKRVFYAEARCQGGEVVARRAAHGGDATL